MNDVELPLGSTVFRLDTDDVTTSSVFATVAAEIMAGIDRSGGLVLTLRPVPGDAAVPLGALARSAAALLHLLDGPGVARAVRACRELGVRAVVVERVELLDGPSAAVIHHLVDVGAALLVCTVSRGAVLPEPIVGLVVSDRLAVADLADQVNITCDRAADDLEDRASVEGSSVGNLTAREREIAEFVVEGWRNREIADRLCVSVRTVEGHVLRLCRKLGVTNRTEVDAHHLARTGGREVAGL